jgi:PTS system nitrogen regulatory IIA component
VLLSITAERLPIKVLSGGWVGHVRSGVDGSPAQRRLEVGHENDRIGGPSLEGRMKLMDFVVRESVIVDLQATGKEEAIREMVGSLHRAGKLANDDLESVIRAILGREELGSTGIGQGVAVPHTRHPTLHRLIGTVALSRRGVDFAALDGEPVDIFFLLVSPQNQPGDHLRALENISRHLKDERFVSFLRQARSREDVIEVLEGADGGPT